MKAFVLAAGIGTRLKPLTSEIPKPMVPVLGKPVLHHTLNNLKKNGFTDICINLFHKPEIITNYFKKSEFNITFSLEKKLLGTAGAVKKQEKFFDDTFVVMSGDGLSDINLKKALAFHKKNKALATIVLKEVDVRLEYGVTLTGAGGKIKSFVEKPSWKDIFANTINTGIYIFEPEIFKFIPKNKFFDFGMDVFPLLLKKKQKLFGYVMKDYWTDIGNVNEYKKGVFDALSGKIKLDISGVKKGTSYISKKAVIDRNVKIADHCFIDDFAIIGAGAVLKPYSVISKNVTVFEKASFERAIIWEDSMVKRSSSLTDSVVGFDCVVPENIVLHNSILMS